MEKDIPDSTVGAFTVSAYAETVREGESVPVHVLFKDAGLIVDNPTWGDKWTGVTFYATLTDSFGRSVDNVVYSGPGGIISNGSKMDIDDSRKFDLVLGPLRMGTYTLKLDFRTRYTVDTWVSVAFSVIERAASPSGGDDTLVDDFTIPGPDNGLEIDDIGNIMLDLRFFNRTNPFVFRSTVRPADAANKQLAATSGDDSVAAIRVDDETTIVITPAMVGKVTMTVRSVDGGAEKSFGVTVYESVPDLDGFTLPTDESERGLYDFDVVGRLALDINEWNDDNPFIYICKPIPASAPDPILIADSDTPEVVVASISNWNRLILKPKSPGYAIVTVKTSDGNVVRKLRVAVISKFTLTIDAREGEQSEDDKKTGIFPCSITFKASSPWYPTRMKMDVYAKGTGRVDLTDSADYFKVDSLKNSRTAYYSVEDKISVLYLSNGNSAYQLYDRVMKKVGAMGVVIHHSADWPDYYDYIVYFNLYKIVLNISVIEEFDTNLYRITIDKKYDSINHRIYQFL